MAISDKVVGRLKVEPGKRAKLAERDCAWIPPGFDGVSKDDRKVISRELLEPYNRELSEAQELLWASNRLSLLVVFQAMDAAGKDGTIKHVMRGVNPQGCKVTSFKQPSAEELDHDFLWRVNRALPERGQIGIFNRSHYEDVLIVRVHPELLVHQRPKDGVASEELWHQRFDSINTFEQHLARNDTRIVKLFLHVSKDEQRRRFLDRLDDPAKRWKFSLGDLEEREFWDDYQAAYEEALTHTSTGWAPWYVIPADHKDVMRALVAAILARTIMDMDLEYPSVDPAQAAALADARRRLESES
jgi:PPK2 family polyphosphate:nucleotide phosphotransferase